MTNEINFYTPALERGKFVQFYLDNKPYIRFRDNKRLHNEIVIEILTDLRLKPFRPFNILSGERYKIIGMGSYHFKDGEIILTDRSEGYGLTPDKKHLDDLTAYLPKEVKMSIM